MHYITADPRGSCYAGYEFENECLQRNKDQHSSYVRYGRKVTVTERVRLQVGEQVQVPFDRPSRNIHNAHKGAAVKTTTTDNYY